MSRTRRSSSRRIRGLMTSSALGGSLLALAAVTPAAAQAIPNACGVHNPGTDVICTAAGGPYDGTVVYDTTTDLMLRLEADAEFNGGIHAETGSTSLRIVGPEATLRSDGSTTIYIFRSPTADVRIDVGDVHYSGSTNEAVYVAGVRSANVTLGDVTSSAGGATVGAQGSSRLSFGDLKAHSTSGDADSAVLVSSAGSVAAVTGSSVTATGYGLTGVRSIGADVIVSLGSITTDGDFGRGLVVESRRSANITVDHISTAGTDSSGVILTGGGGVTLDLGDIRTEGDDSTGVATDGRAQFARIDGHVGSVNTAGDNALGLYLYADVIELTGGSITTTGDESTGAFLFGRDSVNFAFDTISTSGDRASGVSGWAANEFNLNLGQVSTRGAFSHGVNVWGDGAITIRLIEASTLGESSSGVVVESMADGGPILVEAARINTAGDDSTGVLVLANGSPTTVNLGLVSTGRIGQDGSVTGANAHGIEILDAKDVTLSARSVATHGEAADAIRLITLPDAEVDVAALSLETSDDDARGVFVRMGEPGEAVITVDEIVTRGMRSDGVRLQNARNAAIAVRSISTEGEQAHGVWAEVRDEATVTAASVSTAGHGADAVHIEGNSLLEMELGVLTTAGDRAAAVRARGVNVSGLVQQASTTGVESHGVDVQAGDDVNMRIGQVRTAGGDALGVWLRAESGDIQAEIGDVETSGGAAHGVVLTAAGEIEAQIGRILVRNTAANGLVAVSNYAQDITVTQGVTSERGVAVGLTGSEVNFTLGQGGVVRGGEVGIQIDAWDGSHVVLNGTVSARDGMALLIRGGSTVIDNLGNTIEGHISLTDNDDVLNNAGRFTAGGLSDFGDGNDVLNNTGLINLFQATTPRTATFVGLERLNNAGIIGLANGVAQDVFTIDGVLNGQAGNRIELDLDLRGATPLADQIVAGGFEGLSNIVLNVQGRAALGDTGVVIARSGMAQTGAEMDVTTAQGGFVDFDLLFANGEYRLNGDLAPPAFEPTKVATGAQHQWTSGADVVSARFEQMRDGGQRGERGDQVWAQVFGGSNDIEAKRAFDVFGDTLDADLSHEVKSQGVQAGVDRAVALDGSDLTFGMLAGAGRTELRFQNGDETRYDGVGVGAYGHWVSGALSVGVLAKLDTFKLDYDWAEANLKTRSDGFTVGARVDAAWRIAAGEGWYVEPQASLSWSDTSLGRMKARDGNEVVFGDTSSLIGRIGVRAGAEMTVGGGLSFRPYAAAHVLNEFDGDNVSSLLLADEVVRVADRAHGAWGRAVLGASLDAPSGLGGFIQAEGDFGKVEGFTARAGVKFSW